MLKLILSVIYNSCRCSHINAFAKPGQIKRRDYSTATALLLASLLLALSGCATTSEEEEEDPSKQWPVDKLYKEAKQELKDGDYELAIEYFETLQARFPFGKYAEQALLESAYGYYLYDEFDSAIATANRFIRLHPKHPKVDYAYYLRGLASFHKKDTPLDSIAPQDPSKRDPSSARESFNYFSEIVKKFPKSKYAQDAIERMKYQRNTLAKHEMNVANYYMKRGAFVAVVNRAKYVVENYPQTPSIPDALLLMSKAYAKLDMQDLAKDSKRVLDTNYPNYEENITAKAAEE